MNNSFFKKRNGELITYFKYYSLAYNKTIKNLSQPLLIHKNKKNNLEEDIIYLIPELCTMTGFSDKMRKDFATMKDISNHTRISPEARANSLKIFIEKIQNNKDVQNVFFYKNYF